ncbi:MAG: tetratricopeptide repeat protein [Ignavibacteria bacterium]|nr:tetratricopeptide repeat protein [Ignavibacteria bacterium]
MSSRTRQRKTRDKSSGGDNLKLLQYTFLSLCLIIFYLYSSSFDFIQDDSFITYRYVENFVSGHGLVFNIGEKVEGYTCFLWILLLSLIKSLGINFISASVTLGIIFSLLTIYITFRISFDFFSVNQGTFGTLAGFTSVILLSTNGSFAYWASSGMETGLFCFLVTFGIYVYLKENSPQGLKPVTGKIPLSSLIFLLASLTRPEGNLIFAITVLHRIYTVKTGQKQNPSVRFIDKDNITWILIYLIPALIYMAWRLSYYGYFLPNTFYAKTGSSWEYIKTGIDYFWSFSKDYALYGILIALIFTLVLQKEKSGYYIYLIPVFLIFSFYIILVGGDVLRPNRFFLPVLPVFYILLQQSLIRLLSLISKNPSLKFAGISSIVFTVIFAYFTYSNESEQIKKYAELEKGLTEKMKITANWLKNKQTQAGRQLTVAATTIGALSYYSGVNLIDMLGLTDEVVAHQPRPIAEISSGEVGWRERNYNVEYIMSRKPDYIYFSTGIKPSAYAERGLFTSDEFMKYYYPYYFTVKELNFTDVIYKRKTDTEVKDYTNNNPNYSKSFVNLYNQAMNTSRDKTKLNEAIRLYEQAISSGPSLWGTPYQMIGDIYLQLKNKTKAEENYRKAVELDDYNVMAHYYLYQFSLERKDTLSASKHLEKIQKYSPELLK